MAVSCSDAVNNTRLPNYPVYLNLSGAGMWNTYGIGGVGMHREFIKDRQLPSLRLTRATGAFSLLGWMPPPISPTKHGLICPWHSI